MNQNQPSEADSKYVLSGPPRQEFGCFLCPLIVSVGKSGHLSSVSRRRSQLYIFRQLLYQLASCHLRSSACQNVRLAYRNPFDSSLYQLSLAKDSPGTSHPSCLISSHTEVVLHQHRHPRAAPRSSPPALDLHSYYRLRFIHFSI